MQTRYQEPVRLSCPQGGSLQSYLAYSGQLGKEAVLYLHGFGSVRTGVKSQALEQACERRRWTFASFDFRGHGESSGSLCDLRGSALLEDVETVRADLARRGIERVCLVGSSMGGWAAAWFTLRHPAVVPACVLLAPSLDFPSSRWTRLSESERRHWQHTGRLRVQNEWVDAEIGYGLVEEADRYPLQQLLADWHTPLWIGHGMRDDTIPYTESLAFVARCPYAAIELHLWKDGDHRLQQAKYQLAEAVGHFLEQHLGQVSAV
jgi:pimeloyl-ACP methyl ester carboxylesterase